MIHPETDPTDETAFQGSASLPGEVCAQYIRCGKPGCRCEQGQRHGPYYYRIWREGERVHKVYVKRSDLEAVEQACKAHRLQRQLLRDTRLERERLTRGVLQEQRQAIRLRRRLPHAV